jgi:hypothetical protein
LSNFEPLLRNYAIFICLISRLFVFILVLVFARLLQLLLSLGTHQGIVRHVPQPRATISFAGRQLVNPFIAAIRRCGTRGARAVRVRVISIGRNRLGRTRTRRQGFVTVPTGLALVLLLRTPPSGHKSAGIDALAIGRALIWLADDVGGDGRLFVYWKF